MWTLIYCVIAHASAEILICLKISMFNYWVLYSKYYYVFPLATAVIWTKNMNLWFTDVISTYTRILLNLRFFIIQMSYWELFYWESSLFVQNIIFNGIIAVNRVLCFWMHVYKCCQFTNLALIIRSVRKDYSLFQQFSLHACLIYLLYHLFC